MSTPFTYHGINYNPESVNLGSSELRSTVGSIQFVEKAQQGSDHRDYYENALQSYDVQASDRIGTKIQVSHH